MSLDNQETIKNGHGGYRPGSGRPTKINELRLIERLDPMADAAFNAIQKGVLAGEFPYVKLFIEYYAGKPKERVDITSMDEKLNNVIQVEVIRGAIQQVLKPEGDKSTD